MNYPAIDSFVENLKSDWNLDHSNIIWNSHPITLYIYIYLFHGKFPLDSGVTRVPWGKNAAHYVRNTRLGRSITWAVDPDSCVSMKNDTREHCMHRDTSNACFIKRNVPRECLYAFIRGKYARQLYYSLDTYIPFTLRSYIRGNNLLR